MVLQFEAVLPQFEDLARVYQVFLVLKQIDLVLSPQRLTVAAFQGPLFHHQNPLLSQLWSKNGSWDLVVLLLFGRFLMIKSLA